MSSNKSDLKTLLALEAGQEDAEARLSDLHLRVCGSLNWAYDPTASPISVIESGLAELKAQKEDAERKSLQLCNLAGAMMLACKRLRTLQEKHADEPLDTDGQSEGCICEACRISLPDLSDDGLVKQSNARAAVLTRVRGWAQAYDAAEGVDLSDPKADVILEAFQGACAALRTDVDEWMKE